MTESTKITAQSDRGSLLLHAERESVYLFCKAILPAVFYTFCTSSIVIAIVGYMSLVKRHSITCIGLSMPQKDQQAD